MRRYVADTVADQCRYLRRSRGPLPTTNGLALHVGEHCHPRAAQARQRQVDGLDAQRQRNALHQHRVGRPRPANETGDLAQIVVHQGHVRRFDRGIATRCTHRKGDGEFANAARESHIAHLRERLRELRVLQRDLIDRCNRCDGGGPKCRIFEAPRDRADQFARQKTEGGRTLRSPDPPSHARGAAAV